METKEKPKTEEKKVVETIKKEESSEKKVVEEKSKKIENKKKEKPKKTEILVNSYNLPISTKYSVAICKFIKNKTIANARRDLEEVIKLRKVVPMKGEIPHRRGKGISSGRYPKQASKHFITLLKSLAASANSNEIDEPIITEAIANIASRPFGRFGRVKRKRTHIKIIVKNKSKKENKKQEKKNGRKKHN